MANTVSFSLYALLKNPAMLQRTQAEADRVLADGPLTPEKLETMTVWRGTAVETLRRYPVAPVLMAAAARPFVFAGYRVDAAEPITIAPTVSHFLPEVFPDPYAFDIDRYAPLRSEHKQSGAFAPFGLGTHTCLGAGIAEIQAMLIPASLSYEAEFALEPADFVLMARPDPTLTAGDGFKVRPARWRY